MLNVIRKAFLTLSLLLCLFLAGCYRLRPDACMAVTVWPVWAWIAPGLLLTLPGWSRETRRWGGGVIALWLAYLLLLADEPAALLRPQWRPGPEWQAARRAGRVVRVVSLNCAGGSPESAEEVVPYSPDIVLLQESPSKSAVEKVARRLFGQSAGVVYGMDASLIVRGRVTEGKLPRYPGASVALARAKTKTGREMGIVSIRLLPSPLREDIWSPETWRVYRHNREARRRIFRSLLPEIFAFPSDAPLIVGGDFNAPAGDAVYRIMSPRLRDSFREAGRGWGNTIWNETPIHRIDQVWISRHFTAKSVTARKTLHSDHRMVVCDLALAE